MTTTNLMTAHNNWASRPADERFESIDSLEAAATKKRINSVEANMLGANLKFEPVGDDGIIVKGKKAVADISHLAIRQIATDLSVPVGILDHEKLPTSMICDILNERVKRTYDPSDEVKLLLDKPNDQFNIRCVTSDSYTRFWDDQTIPFMRKLEKNGWSIPPARPALQNQPGIRKATKEDVLKLSKVSAGLAINEGDNIAPAGLYMGDRDMFAFFVDDTNPVEDGFGNPLMRGCFLYNSEVGTGSFKITTFIMQGVCGNHIVWGAQDIVQVNYKHVGQVHSRIREAFDRFTIPNRSWEKELRVINWMRTNTIGKNLEEVVDNVYNMRLSQSITKKVLSTAYSNAERTVEVDHQPNTWFGIANALTRYSQTSGNADDRMALDIGAGKLFDKASRLATV